VAQALASAASTEEKTQPDPELVPGKADEAPVETMTKNNLY
jgi:hypothetical protein